MTPWTIVHQDPLSMGDSPGKNIGVGCHSLLQRTFGSNPGFPHYRQILYCLSHQGSPRILEWVTYPFSRGSSWPRDRTGVSWFAGRSSTAELSGKPSESVSCSVESNSLRLPWTVDHQAPLSMEFSRQITGVGCQDSMIVLSYDSVITAFFLHEMWTPPNVF